MLWIGREICQGRSRSTYALSGSGPGSFTHDEDRSHLTTPPFIYVGNPRLFETDDALAKPFI